MFIQVFVSVQLSRSFLGCHFVTNEFVMATQTGPQIAMRNLQLRSQLLKLAPEKVRAANLVCLIKRKRIGRSPVYQLLA